jgi:hypothetical protein
LFPFRRHPAGCAGVILTGIALHKTEYLRAVLQKKIPEAIAGFRV